MSVQYNPIRRSEKDQPGGVAGLDSEGLLNVPGVVYQQNLGQEGFPPVIAEGGAIEAVVQHREIDASDDPPTVPLDGEIAILNLNGNKLLTIGDGVTANGNALGMKTFTGSNIEITESRAGVITLPGLGPHFREILIYVSSESDATVEVELENGETFFQAFDLSDNTVSVFGEAPLTVTGNKTVIFKPITPFIASIDPTEPIVFAPTIDRSAQPGKPTENASIFVTMLYTPIVV